MPIFYFISLGAVIFIFLFIASKSNNNQSDLIELINHENNIRLNEVVKTNSVTFPDASRYNLELEKKLEKQKLILKDVNLAYIINTFIDLFNSKKNKHKIYFSSGVFFSTKKCPFTIQRTKGDDEVYDYIFLIDGIMHRIIIKQNILDVVFCLFKNEIKILSCEAYPLNTTNHYDISYAIASIYNVYITSSKLTDIDLKHLCNIIKLVSPGLDEEYSNFILEKKHEIEREKSRESDEKLKGLF